MNNQTNRFLIVTFGVAFTVLAVVILVEILRVIPLPDIAELNERYWGDPWPGGTFLEHLGFVLFMLMRVWMLWAVPLLGIGAMAWALQARNQEELTAYLERIHLLEKALKESRDEGEGAAAHWLGVNRKLDELFENAPEAWVVVDRASGIRRWNRTAMDMARRKTPLLDSLEGRPLSEVADIRRVTREMATVLEDGRVWSGEFFAADQQQWFSAWAFPLGDEMAMVLRDVSYQHRDEGFLKSTEALLRQLVEDSEQPLAILDTAWNYMFVSRGWSGVMGLPAATILAGRNHREVVPDFPADIEGIEQKLAHGKPVGRDEERRMVHGREMVLDWKIEPWHGAGGHLGGYVFHAVDVAEVVRLRQQVTQAEERENALAYSDALTGLPNRQLFNDRLNMALAQAYRQLGKVALFFLDLDGFKGVNDQLGHDYGDLLLKQVAERLKTVVRSTDTVARLGGDEFTIILSIRDRKDAEQVAEKLLVTIRKPYDLNGKVADKVGTSIGIAIYPQDGTQAADLMKKADGAMYAAKQAGKNTYRFATMEIKVKA